jgi:hypothetical protein
MASITSNESGITPSVFHRQSSEIYTIPKGFIVFNPDPNPITSRDFRQACDNKKQKQYAAQDVK